MNFHKYYGMEDADLAMSSLEVWDEYRSSYDARRSGEKESRNSYYQREMSTRQYCDLTGKSKHELLRSN